MDGVRLNDSRQGMADLSQIPVESIERIEVLRGGTSALYGADALGGVVNIITKSRAEKTFTLTVNSEGYIPHDAIRVSEGPTETPVSADLWTWWIPSVSVCRLPGRWARWTCSSQGPSQGQRTALSGTTSSTSMPGAGRSMPSCSAATRLCR